MGWFNYNDKNEYPIYFGQRILNASKNPASKPEGTDAVNWNGKNIFILGQQKGQPPADLTEGLHELASISDQSVHWIVTQIAAVNPSVPPLVTDLTKTLGPKENRSFLKDFMRADKFYVKEIKGKYNVIFKGNTTQRRWIRGAKYLLENKKIKVMNILAKTSSGDVGLMVEGGVDALKDTGLGFILVAGLDCLQYYTSSNKHKELGDLIGKILGDEIKLAVATLIAVVAVAAIAALAAAVALEIPIAVLVVGGIILIGAITEGLDWIDEKVGFTEELKKMSNKAINFLSSHSVNIEHAIKESVEQFKLINLPLYNEFESIEHLK